MIRNIMRRIVFLSVGYVHDCSAGQRDPRHTFGTVDLLGHLVSFRLKLFVSNDTGPKVEPLQCLQLFPGNICLYSCFSDNFLGSIYCGTLSFSLLTILMMITRRLLSVNFSLATRRTLTSPCRPFGTSLVWFNCWSRED